MRNKSEEWALTEENGVLSFRAGMGIVVGLVGLFPSWGMAEAVTGAQIRVLGLEARLDPVIRDAHLQQIAAHMGAMDAEAVHAIQGDFQYALMLMADPEIYDTLHPESIEAVDHRLEALFDLEAIDRDNHWEPLVYAYGFFNRDVDLQTIRDVVGRWEALSDSEKAPRFPTYIHVIDAVTKPVSMGLMGDVDNTRAVLEIVVPLLKDQFLQPPAPGTAFHPPSHACLVLGPLYDRWIDHPELGGVIRKHLGTRADFEAMLASQLPGGLPGGPPPSHMTYGYYAYIGSYLANTLARLDARSAVPALNRSITIYTEHKAKGRNLAYTRRALLALGDPEARSAFDAMVKDPAQRKEAIDLAVWCARNGRDETREFGLKYLGHLLQCTPEAALDTYFQQEADALKT